MAVKIYIYKKNLRCPRFLTSVHPRDTYIPKYLTCLTSGFRGEVTELDLDVKQVMINQGSSFEQSRSSAILFLRRYLQGFYHTGSWQTSWLCDLNHLNKLSFLHAKKASYKIWLQIVQLFFFLKKASFNCNI